MKAPTPAPTVFLVKRGDVFVTEHNRPTDVHGMAMSEPQADEFIAWWEGQRQERVDIVRALCCGR